MTCHRRCQGSTSDAKLSLLSYTMLALWVEHDNHIWWYLVDCVYISSTALKNENFQSCTLIYLVRQAWEKVCWWLNKEIRFVGNINVCLEINILSLTPSTQSGPEFDGLLFKFFDGHFLNMYVIWRESAKTNMSFDVQVLIMKSSIWCFIIIHFLTIENTQRYTNKHNYLTNIMKSYKKNHRNWILNHHIFLNAQKIQKKCLSYRDSSY